MIKSPNYLIIKACAGLGNRLVTIFAAIKYCENNNRILVIDWTDGQFDKKGIDAFRKCFHINNIKCIGIEEITDWNVLKHSSDLFKNNKQEGVYDLYIAKYSLFWSKIPSSFIYFSWQKKLIRSLQSIKNNRFYNSLNFGSDLPDNLKDQVLYYVDFLPEIDYNTLPDYIRIKPFLANNINQYVLQENLTKAIGIHIRNTDKRPTTDVKKIIDHIKIKHPETSVFLSTDSSEIEEFFQKNISNLILFPKTKPKLNGEGLHQWALYNNEDDLKYTLYEESVMEMFLLSKCNYLYYQGNSTFSNISKVYHTNKNNCYDWLKL